MDPRNFKTSYPCHMRPEVEEDTITTRCYDAASLPPGRAPDRFAVESSGARRVARGTEHSLCRMEDRDVFDRLDSWAGRDGRGVSREGGILLVEEEKVYEVLKVFLLNVPSELPDRCQRISACFAGCQ